MIDPSVIADIKANVSIERVVGMVVKLKKAGRDMKGLCPFHQERTPSFVVSDDRGTYHCYGCGAHGGVIDFVMAHERIDFVKAVEQFAVGEVAMVPRQADGPARGGPRAIMSTAPRPGVGCGEPPRRRAGRSSKLGWPAEASI